ncbi:hypothetical protein ACQKM2_23215 [Streptomyces sp. NPDC004126]|uniref:hypothetical protein n=1 Tax=Streptomyces sp. NPDC004126 TaxID=3390695 RepID=UPI003D070F25
MFQRLRTDAECTAIADRLPLPQPFDLNTFCDGIAEQRGRPLVLLPLDGPPDPALPCGMWVGLDVADLVFYDAAAPGVLRVQIVLHEVSHMLLGHVAPEFAPARTDTSPATGAELPVAAAIRAEAARIRAAASESEAVDEELGLDVGRIAHLMGRSRYSTPQERKAETLATLIHERASRAAQSASPRHEDQLVRLQDTLGHPIRST